MKQLFIALLAGVIVLICQLTEVWTNKDCGLLDSNNKNAIPWMVNIYQLNENGGHEFICSGTLLSRKIILTAARCFYDDITKNIRNATFAVSVGQTHKAWSSNNGQNIQIREIPIGNIFITEQYKGILDNYSCNIAIVKLNSNQKFNLEGADKRACIYWDNDFVESQLEVNPPALKVIAWGEGNNSTFTVLEPSYVNFEECYSLVTTKFQRYLTYDKMCARLEGSHSVSNIGSGLYALNTVKNRWYLIGVASEVSSADSKTYITFTKIQPHLNWISNTAFLQVR